MPRRPEVLTDIPDAAAEYALETPQPERIPGSSLSRAVYVHRSSQERWLAKSPVQQDSALTHQFLLREKIANDIYAYYGVGVPRLAFADLPCQYIGMDEKIRDIYVKEYKLTHAPHLLSRWLDRFNSYGRMPMLTGGEVMQLDVSDQLVPERGLGHILAVAHFINDVDVIGGSGDNIGYKLSITPDGQLYAQSCKIDPGEAFFEIDQASSRTVTTKIRLATTASQTYVAFDQLPRQTQQEFLSTLRDILQTPSSDIARFFQRKGAESLEKSGFTAKAIACMKARKASLRAVFEAALLADKKARKEAKEAKVELSAAAQLPDELRPLYAQALLEQSNPLYRQAEHFFVEPFTENKEDKEKKDEEKEAKQQPFSTMLASFLTHRDARVLLLLGDSGFGKSTATQRITQQHWEAYFKESKTTRVPIRIELKQFGARTVQRCVENSLLDDYHLTPPQINALKQRPCLIILDGFDEIGDRAKCNLWDMNGLSQWRDVKLVITCRTVYLDPGDIRQYFYPAGRQEGLQRRSLVPFDAAQIEAYLAKALAELPVTLMDVKAVEELKEEKQVKAEIRKVKKTKKTKEEKELKKAIPSKIEAKQLAESTDLQELLQVPLMLKIFSDALPTLQKEQSDLRQLNRFHLYEAFMAQWFERNRARLSQNLGKALSTAQCEGFLAYSQDLAFELFKAKQIQIDYAPGQVPWDRFFSDNSPEIVQSRSGCPLRRAGKQYSFIHKSFYEFFLAQRIVRLARSGDKAALIAWLSVRRLKEEPQVLRFLEHGRRAGYLDHKAVQILLTVVTDSAKQPAISQASANAAMILNACRIDLSQQQWQGVQLPGADLNYAILAHTDLRGANLKGAALLGAKLGGVNLTGANLEEALLSAAELVKADLTGANLMGAWLREAIMPIEDEDLETRDLWERRMMANLMTGDNRGDLKLPTPNLTGANLSEANLAGVDLTEVDLAGADLRGADLTGANLTGADLTRADLTGANLTRADLTEANLAGANLTGANLFKAGLNETDLEGANLTRANLREVYLWCIDLRRANLAGVDLTEVALDGKDDVRGANLTGATLRGADLTKVDLTEVDLDGADLRGANLTGVNLTGADLTRADLTGANLREANLTEANLKGANLKGANLREANLEEAYLRGANLTGANLTGANLKGANLREANLTEANLKGANLTRANLEGANLREANLREANLNRAKLEGADLRGADLKKLNLKGADLRGADLRGADLKEVNLTKANLAGADLRGANLIGGVNLRRANLTGATLRGADLRGADLAEADLRGADLRGADLAGADLAGADLVGADLGEANLFEANLRRANLIRADLSRANLEKANLIAANLAGANLERENLIVANLGGANLTGAQLKNCLMDKRSKRLLEKRGVDVRMVKLPESESKAEVEATMREMPLLEEGSDLEIKRESKITTRAPAVPAAALSSASSSASVSAPAGEVVIPPLEKKVNKKRKAPSAASTVTSHSSSSSSSSVSSAALPIPSPVVLSSSASTSSSAAAEAIATRAPDLKLSAPTVATQGLFAAPRLDQQVRQLMDHLSHELKKQPSSAYDRQAAASFTVTVLVALRKNQLSALLENPEDHGLPEWLAPVVAQYTTQHPLLWARQSRLVLLCVSSWKRS